MTLWTPRRSTSVIAAFLLLLLTTTLALAGNGSIKGTVTDSEKGEPVMAANVVVLVTELGAATDLDGKFYIIGVRPGVFEVEISCIGYHMQKITGVVVQSDLTTDLNVKLTPSTITLKETVIKYKKPEVILDKSTSGTRFGKDALVLRKPESINAIISSTKGFKVDQEGKWHVRGARAGSVAIVVDGIDQRDPQVDTQTNLSISAEAVDEVNILTGGFNAEYGRAGAVVQVTSAEGPKTHYTGRVEYQTDRIIETYSFDTDRMELNLGGPLPYTRSWLGRPITFYWSSTGYLTNTYTPFNINRPANDYLDLGINLPERQDNSYQTSLKLSYNLSEAKKLTLSLSHNYHKWDIYPNGEGGVSGNYGYGYKYNLAHRPWAQNRQFSGSLTYTNQLSSRTYYTLQFITFRTHSTVQPRGKNPGEFTLLSAVENNFAQAYDRNGNGWLDPDEYSDSDGDGFMDGFWDANRNNIFDGGGEGYEDLNMNGRWDRGEDWVDLNGNGIYDAAEPWVDVVNPLTGENNIGVWDPWDSYVDINGNGRWDAAEPQLPEQDWNGNGRWDGERFIDANGNGKFDPWEPYTDLNNDYRWNPGEPFEDKNGNGVQDDGEGYDDKNRNGKIDKRDLVSRVGNPDYNEPFIDGDFWWDTGEPFIDEPDPITGLYNGKWDRGEIWFDLPSSANQQTGAGLWFVGRDMTLNGKYDGPNFLFDEYELFTRPVDWNYNSDRSRPIWYAWDEEARGADWPDRTVLFSYIPGKSTWVNRTLHDTANPQFDMRNYSYDVDKEWFKDLNNNGQWDRADRFLNEGEWDPTAFWQDRVSTEYTVKYDIQSQVSKHHEMKGGLELKYRDLQMQSISQPDLLYTGEAELPAGSKWPERGGVRDFYHYQPIEGAGYVQDKMEFEGLIVNAGLRLDFIVHDKKIIDEFTARLERDEPGAIVAERGKYRISPRLGISHPITERSKLYFNYGHFYQAPSFQYYYKSATANFEANTTIGNPNLEYEKTIQYELGVNTQISDYIVFDISGYYKDQYDLISTADERWKNLTLDRYVNLDYGRMRGFEFTIEKRPSHHYAVTFNYDFSYAYGKASDQHANQANRLRGIPYNYDEHPLDWDETHKINAFLTILYDKGEYPRLLGFTLPDDWMMSLQWDFGSGTPYTPSKYTTGIENTNLILPNSARTPWRERTTLKFEKYYTLDMKKGNRAFFGFTVGNLFNKRNIVGLYTETGSPTQAVHPLNPSYNPADNRAEYDANPRNYDSPRNVLFRVGMTF
ncbi:MAG: TonB-dependent receptor [Calditrichaeota bacterium]|nr:TonB-dependent receptor [Calditrichota bacterium]